MNARGLVVAEPDGAGGARLSALRSEAPLLLRATPTGLHMVGGAAGPVGGDRVRLDLDVRAGAVLTIASVAASVALPGRSGRPSTMEVVVSVGAGACLRWLPEPIVAASGCRHRVDVRIAASAGATVVWREELIAGRHGESGGSVASGVSVEVDGHPLLRQELAIGPDHPAWQSPAVTAGARAVGSVVVVDPRWADAPPSATVLGGGSGAVLPLAGPGAQVTAVAADARTLRALLDAGVAFLGPWMPEVSPGVTL